MVFYLLLAIFFVLLDRFLKILALNNVFNPPIKIVGDFFQFSLMKNYYIAFSLPLGGWILNILIILVLFFLISYWLVLNKKKEAYLTIPLTFIIFGAISNLLDRLKHGFVVDYFSLKYFTVFNLADVMIVSGVFLIIFYNFKKV